MKRLFLIPFLTVLCIAVSAQTSMRLHYKDGTHVDVPLSSLDYVTFEDSTNVQTETGLTGNWVWASHEYGYYELLTLNEDNTFTGYDNFFEYGFDSFTYGFYARYGSMLTLWSNGYGYQHRYNWFVTGVSDNALTVITQTGPLTYFRLLPDVIYLQSGGSPMTCDNGDSIVFADGVVVKATDAGLQPIAPGTTYILKHFSATNKTFAYKVIVT